jgi:hypothetical protein
MSGERRRQKQAAQASRRPELTTRVIAPAVERCGASYSTRVRAGDPRADRTLAGGIRFAIANALLIVFGIWCWTFPVRRGWPSARGVAWFWAALEIANGTIHSGLAVARAGYFPGVLTAPLLIATGAWLSKRLAASA